MAAPSEWWCFKPCSNPDLETPYTSRNHRWREDNEHIDPRIRSFFKALPWRIQSDDAQWVPLLNSDALAGGESLASSEGLKISRERIVSVPDDNSISLSVMIPDCASSSNLLPCIVYCHGGGMSHYSWYVLCHSPVDAIAFFDIVVPLFRQLLPKLSNSEPITRSRWSCRSYARFS
mmetsp:Transcript_6291/g.10277  ORF Transcript_6291/g.10277 Transcript_6291/m.10277 type:complete len:176 (+) Transcript_6291:36-563(+)